MTGISSAEADWDCRRAHCVAARRLAVPLVSCHVCCLRSPSRLHSWMGLVWQRLHQLSRSYNWSLRNKLPPGFVYLRPPSSLIQTSIQRCADTVDHTSAMMPSLRPITAQPISFHPPPITTSAAAVSSSFLPLWVSSNGVMIPPEAAFNITECDLGENAWLQTTSTGFEDLWKQALLLLSNMQRAFQTRWRSQFLNQCAVKCRLLVDSHEQDSNTQSVLVLNDEDCVAVKHIFIFPPEISSLGAARAH